MLLFLVGDEPNGALHRGKETARKVIIRVERKFCFCVIQGNLIKRARVRVSDCAHQHGTRKLALPLGKLISRRRLAGRVVASPVTVERRRGALLRLVELALEQFDLVVVLMRKKLRLLQGRRLRRLT